MDKQNLFLESKIHAIEELLMVSESSFLEEAKKLEEANEQLHNEIKEHERLESDIKQILDASGNAIKVIDKEYNIIYVNNAFLKFKGIQSDLRGKKCYEVIPEKECFTEDCLLQQVVKSGEKVERELCSRAADSAETHYSVNAIPYSDAAGALIGVIISYKDITREKLAHKIAEENALQQGRIEMSNNMMHDIGNALTGISICTIKPQTEKDWPEIMSLQKLNDLFASKAKELIGILGEEKEKTLISFIEALKLSLQQRNSHYIEFCEKISHTIGHISSILELQKYYLKEKITPLATILSVRKLVEDALIILSSNLQRRKIAVRISTDGSAPNVSGDQTRLMRMLLNIIKNIYEAFDEVESKDIRRLDIKIASDIETQEVKIVFSDNGAGFAPENGEKLFERGFSTKQNGSGIGLHECRAIIESHGGTIAMKSKGKNAGSETVIKFPLLNDNKGR